MGRARRARKIAATAAYGGGGIAAIGAALGAAGWGVIKAEAALARRVIGTAFDDSPDDNGIYGSGRGEPYDIVVLGDSSAAGVGTEAAHETVGAIIASGVAALTGRRVRLTNRAVVGAESSDLERQLANALEDVHAARRRAHHGRRQRRDPPHRAQRRRCATSSRPSAASAPWAPRSSSAPVPDLGTIQPIQPAAALPHEALVARPRRRPDRRGRRGRRSHRVAGRPHRPRVRRSRRTRCSARTASTRPPPATPGPPPRCSRACAPPWASGAPTPADRAPGAAAWRGRRAGRRGGRPRRRGARAPRSRQTQIAGQLRAARAAAGPSPLRRRPDDVPPAGGHPRRADRRPWPRRRPPGRPAPPPRPRNLHLRTGTAPVRRRTFAHRARRSRGYSATTASSSTSTFQRGCR